MKGKKLEVENKLEQLSDCSGKNVRKEDKML